MEKLKEKTTDPITNNKHSLILFNDDINSFEYVIVKLMEIFNYDIIQAEQLTLIAHNKGKVVVKSDLMDILMEYQIKLLFAGLNCEIKN